MLVNMTMRASVQKISNPNEVHTDLGNTKSGVISVEKIQEESEADDRRTDEGFGSKLKIAELA